MCLWSFVAKATLKFMIKLNFHFKLTVKQNINSTLLSSLLYYYFCLVYRGSLKRTFFSSVHLKLCVFFCRVLLVVLSVGCSVNNEIKPRPT